MTHTANNELTTRPGAPFVPGELVNVTIRGALVDDLDCPGDDIFATLRIGGWRTVMNLHADGVQVERVAPTEWPPQPADVWTDRNGYAWAALGDSVSGGVEMICTHDRHAVWSDPAEVLTMAGPMRLEYRPGWTRQPDPVPAGPAEVDKRAEKIAGLRALADLAESRPDLNFDPYRIIWQAGGNEGVQAWAAALGTSRIEDHLDSDGDRHCRAESMLRGIQVAPYYIEYAPKPEPETARPVPAWTAVDDEPTQPVKVVIADGSNGPAGLIAVAPVDEPVGRVEIEETENGRRITHDDGTSVELVKSAPVDEPRTPEQWGTELGIRVLDPDGWRGADGRDWADPISRDEYERRMSVSTVTGATSEVEDEDDDHCQARLTKEDGEGSHLCELYGPHPEVKHICACGKEWPNDAPSIDVEQLHESMRAEGLRVVAGPGPLRTVLPEAVHGAGEGTWIDPVTGLVGGGLVTDDAPADAVE